MIKFCKLSEDTIILFNEQKLYKFTLGLPNNRRDACYYNCFYDKLEDRYDDLICSDLLRNDIGLVYNDKCITAHFEYRFHSKSVIIKERVQEIKCSLLLSLYLSKIEMFNIEELY